MPSNRDIQYINIKNPAILNSSAIVKKGFAEVNYILSLFEKYPDNKTYVPVLYVYCTVNNSFFRVVGINNIIILEQLTISLNEFKVLHNEYQSYFINFDPTTYRSFEYSEFHTYQQVWQKLFSFFIPPFDFAIKPKKPINIFISLTPVDEKSYVFDLSAIFDLKFRFFPLKTNIAYYVLSVSGLSIVEFAEKLVGLFKPIAKQTVLLYGFDKHYSEDFISRSSELTISLAMARESLYSKMLNNAKLAGVKVVDLNCNDDLMRCFKKGMEGHFIQIIAHYTKKSDNKNGRLYFKRSSIRFDIFERLLDDMNSQEVMRNDVIIDAVTCTNFFDFKTLYSKGFRYMHLSHHDFDTDQAAFVLNELYTGVNAARLNWENSYLNGNNHFHEARSNIYRCFYSLSREKCYIFTP